MCGRMRWSRLGPPPSCLRRRRGQGDNRQDVMSYILSRLLKNRGSWRSKGELPEAVVRLDCSQRTVQVRAPNHSWSPPFEIILRLEIALLSNMMSRLKSSYVDVKCAVRMRKTEVYESGRIMNIRIEATLLVTCLPFRTYTT